MLTQDIALMQAAMAQVLIGSLFALLKAILLWKTRVAIASTTFNGTNDQLNLTKQQLELLGINPKFEHAESKSSKEPPKSIAKASITFKGIKF
ncbi:hypothetical protein OROHE_009494 [Orobanche hederae]